MSMSKEEREDINAAIDTFVNIIEKRTDERDRWKSRCEALENAILTGIDSNNICYLCKHHGKMGFGEQCEACYARDDQNALWVFDETRFAKGSDSGEQ